VKSLPFVNIVVFVWGVMDGVLMATLEALGDGLREAEDTLLCITTDVDNLTTDDTDNDGIIIADVSFSLCNDDDDISPVPFKAGTDDGVIAMVVFKLDDVIASWNDVAFTEGVIVSDVVMLTLAKLISTLDVLLIIDVMSILEDVISIVFIFDVVTIDDVMFMLSDVISVVLIADVIIDDVLLMLDGV